MDMEFLVISLVAEEASTPAYHALTTVLKRPKASMAIVIPKTVREVRSLCLKEFLRSSLSICIQYTLVQMPDDMRFLGCARVMGNHYYCFPEFMHEPFHEVQYLFCRYAV